MADVTDQLTGLMGPVVAGGVVLKFTDHILGAGRGRKAAPRKRKRARSGASRRGSNGPRYGGFSSPFRGM